MRYEAAMQAFMKLADRAEGSVAVLTRAAESRPNISRGEVTPVVATLDC